MRLHGSRLVRVVSTALAIVALAMSAGCTGASSAEKRPDHVLRSTPPHDAISPDTRYRVVSVERTPKPDSDILIARVVLDRWAPPMQAQAAAYDVLERMEEEQDFRVLWVDISDYPEFAKLGDPTIGWWRFGPWTPDDAHAGVDPVEVYENTTHDPAWRTRPTQQQVDVWAAWRTLVKESGASKQEADAAAAAQRSMTVDEVKDAVAVCDRWQLRWVPTHD